LIFKDRTDAARKLAEKLQYLKNEPLIMAIPRGGVVTGDVIASTLGAKLDLVVPRKLGAPYNPELAIGAVMHDGSCFLNREIIGMLNVQREYIEKEISMQMKEIERRLILFRGRKDYELKDKIVVLVDDGIATGATMFAAVEWVRKQNAQKIIVAVPVGPMETMEKLKASVDQVVFVLSPVLFGAVGEFYENFEQVSDDEVCEIMRKYGYNV
jgi:predicted phosphoribosyltransferase